MVAPQSKVVPKKRETALNSSERAAARNLAYTEAASDKDDGQLEAGYMETVREALVADPAPDLNG